MAEYTVRQVRGDLRKVAADLHKAARQDIRKSLRRSMTESTKPVRRKIREAARERLPQSGGLAAQAAVMPSARTEFRGRDTQVRIVMRRGKWDLAGMDEGSVRHPLFGNRQVWVTQSVRGGFFRETIEREAPDIGREVEADLRRTLDHLGR